MSQWTHVNGSIRVDHLRSITSNIDFNDIFRTTHWEDDNWDDCNMPCGSEGSLDINIWTAPSKSSIAAYTINIFGDLRDYENKEEIINWFHKLITKTFLMVRAAALTIHVEGSAFINLTLYDDKIYMTVKGDDKLCAKYALLGYEVIKID